MRKFVLCTLVLMHFGHWGFAQDAKPFNTALTGLAEYLTARIPENSKLVILNFLSDYPNLSEYVIDEITSAVVNTDRYTVVDRRSLAVLQEEMNFQLSGEVNEETAQAIGQKLGAQTIISGAVNYLEDFYRLRVQAIEVQSARILGSETVNIAPSRFLASLTGIPYTESEPEPVPEPAPKSTIPQSQDAREIKIFYGGIRGGASTHFYQLAESYWGEGQEGYSSLSGDYAAQFALQIAPLFAIQTELAVTGDTMETKYGIPASMDNNTLMIPLLAKFTFRPGIWLFAVFGGAYVSIPLREMVFTAGGRTYRYNYEPVMGYTAGVNAGVKFGPGTLFMDIRYGGDFSDTQLSGSWGSEAVYKRNQLFYALGYEIGFGNRKGK